MPKYSIGCEGTQEEFYAFLLDLSKKIQWATNPWDHPSIEAALYKKTAEEINPPSEQNPSQPTPLNIEEPQVSPEELRTKSIAFGKAGGQQTMKKFLAQLGVTKLSELDSKQRVIMSNLIDEASKKLKSAVLEEGSNA